MNFDAYPTNPFKLLQKNPHIFDGRVATHVAYDAVNQMIYVLLENDPLCLLVSVCNVDLQRVLTAMRIKSFWFRGDKEVFGYPQTFFDQLESAVLMMTADSYNLYMVRLENCRELSLQTPNACLLDVIMNSIHAVESFHFNGSKLISSPFSLGLVVEKTERGNGLKWFITVDELPLTLTQLFYFLLKAKLSETEPLRLLGLFRIDTTLENLINMLFFSPDIVLLFFEDQREDADARRGIETPSNQKSIDNVFKKQNFTNEIYFAQGQPMEIKAQESGGHYRFYLLINGKPLLVLLDCAGSE